MNIIICDDDPLCHHTFKEALKSAQDEIGKQQDLRCFSAFSSEELFQILNDRKIEVILLDIQLKELNEGLHLIRRVLKMDPEISIVVVSGRSDFETVREAMRLGAKDYFAKEGDPEEIIHILKRIFERQILIRHQSQQNFEVMTHQSRHVLIGESQAMKNLHRTITKVARSQANVVITGETGTGKEVVARQLRQYSVDQYSLNSYSLKRNLGPFVAVDSSTIQSTMAESYLFGHEKGAFTGATKVSKGIFEEANGGIVYFDEISNMPLDIQAKLLRVLQEKEICRLGSNRIIPLSFRVICASNQNLEQMVVEGRFKPDLLQRLNVIPIVIPPLRDRLEDLPALIQHFINISASHAGLVTPHLEFSEEAFATLYRHPWPGNVRELANLVTYLLTMIDHPRIEIRDLPPYIQSVAPQKSEEAHDENCGENRNEPSSVAHSSRQCPQSQSFHEAVYEFEKTFLLKEYSFYDGNVSRMARGLSMDRSNLHSKLKTHKIHAQPRR